MGGNQHLEPRASSGKSNGKRNKFLWGWPGEVVDCTNRGKRKNRRQPIIVNAQGKKKEQTTIDY